MAKPNNHTSNKHVAKTKLAAPMAQKAPKEFANIFIFDQPLGEVAELKQTVVEATKLSSEPEAPAVEVQVVIAKVNSSSMTARREARKLQKAFSAFVI